MNSKFADISNDASTPFGGAISAALFLQNFITCDAKWLHFDINGWNNSALLGRPEGGEAMGIRSVYQLLQNKFSAA
jgi:leucyl aminopeptidase